MLTTQITWVAISRSAIRHNIRQLQRIVSPSTQFMAVVKSNAYGHGLIEVAKIAKQAKVSWLATVNLDEALELRASGIKGRILVLSYYHPDKIKEAIKKNITLTVYGYAAAKKINAAAKLLRTKTKVHFKVDTGTSRLGVLPLDCAPMLHKIRQLDNIKIEGIFSHFADAENLNQAFTNRQINTFNKIVSELEIQNIKIPLKHLACSASTILNKESHQDLIRIGIALYGLWSIEKKGWLAKKLLPGLNLRPALSWYTTIIQLKKLPPHSTVGYGASYKTNKDTTLALVPVGYWEGYDRKLSNTGEVIIRGKRCSIRGRVCMNLMMIDVTSLPNVKVGDRVILIGQEGKESITADELANKIKTINYEIITRINPLINRVYIK
ncbi:alanine racemase [Patescibacteria group bacterium]|nr:alanine racemase [Patescibacteria group bacterium]